MSRLVLATANGSVEVVAIGPDLADDDALELVRQFDHDRPDISVLIVAPPSTDLLQPALRAGARDVISPDAPAPELHAALERAFEAASHRKEAFDLDDEPGVDHA